MCSVTLNTFLFLLILVTISSSISSPSSSPEDSVDSSNHETDDLTTVPSRREVQQQQKKTRLTSDATSGQSSNLKSSNDSSIFKSAQTTISTEPTSLVTDLIGAPSDTLDAVVSPEGDNIESDYSETGAAAEDSDLSLTDDFLFKETDDENEGSSFKIPQDAVEFMDYFDDLVSKVKGGLEKVFNRYLPTLFEMSSTIVLSPDCTYDVVRILLALREMKPWAIKLLDASGKVPEGILSGTLSSLGDYDECLDTKLMDPESEMTRLVTGQYCSINIKPFLPPKPPSNSLNRIFNEAADAKGFPKKDHFSRLAPIFYYLKFRLGVCIPSSCSTSDLKTITNTISMKVRLNVTAERCEVKESYIANQEQIVAGSILLVVLLIVLITTIIDVIRRFVIVPRRRSRSLITHLGILSSSPTNWSKSSSSSSSPSSGSRGHQLREKQTIREKIRFFFHKLTVSFSAYTNVSKVLTSTVPDDSIRCLYGLKVINLVWIIFAHAYLTLDLKAVGQLLQTQKVNSLFLFQVVMNASLAVESFFFISGLLVTLTILRKLKVNPNMSIKEWAWFYLHRLMRMTPAVALVIAIVVSAFQLSDGPLWREIIYPSAERCKNNWWIHILHISNFFDVSRMCFLHLWYIAADMQLFFVTPFLILLLHKKPVLGRFTVFALTLVSIVSTGVVTYLDHLPPTLLFDNPDPLSRKPFGNLILVKPFPHAAPYFIGILTAYFMFMKPDMKMKKSVSVTGWICSVFIILFACFITWNWNQGFYPSPVLGAIYAATFRSLWALAMAWIVIACHYGHGGIVSTVLDWSPFIPMSRVSYTAYLIHPGLMYVFVASTRNLFMFGHFLVMYLFLAHLLATFLASFFLSLIIEIPFVTFEQSFYVYFFGGDDSRNSLYRSSKYFYNVNPDADPFGALHPTTSSGNLSGIKNSGDDSVHKTSTPLSGYGSRNSGHQFDRYNQESDSFVQQDKYHHGHVDHMRPSFPMPASSKYHHHVTSHHHTHSEPNVLTQRMNMVPVTKENRSMNDCDDVVPVLVTQSVPSDESSVSGNSSTVTTHSLEQKNHPITGKIYSVRL